MDPITIDISDADVLCLDAVISITWLPDEKSLYRVIGVNGTTVDLQPIGQTGKLFR